MASYEIVNSGPKIEIHKFDDDQSTHKNFKDVRAQAMADLQLEITAYDPVSVKDTKYWALRGKLAMLKSCTEKSCEILRDKQSRKRRAPPA